MVSIAFGPTFVPEFLEPIVIVATERPKVSQHFIHEADIARGPGVADLLPPLGDHEIPRPQESSFRMVVGRLGVGQVSVHLGRFSLGRRLL